MSDEVMKEAEKAFMGKVEELSGALDKGKTEAVPIEEDPIEREAIPTRPSIYKAEQIESILRFGGDAVSDGFKKALGVKYKEVAKPAAAPAVKPAAAPAAAPVEKAANAPKASTKNSLDAVSDAEIDKAISAQEKKINYLEQFRKFRERYAGMTDEEIKADIEFGMKYFQFLEGRKK